MKKSTFGLLVTILSFVFFIVCFVDIFIIDRYSSYNGITGPLASLLGNDEMLVPFVVSLLGLVVGLFICGYEAYRKKN